MLTKAYGKSAMSKTRVYEWYMRFQDGRKDVESGKSERNGYKQSPNHNQRSYFLNTPRMWSGVILIRDDAFTSCQFWPLFLDFFVQFH